MNEWKQWLHQTHPLFKQVEFVDSKEMTDLKVEKKGLNTGESNENPLEFEKKLKVTPSPLELQTENSTPPKDESETPTSVDLTWIQSTEDLKEQFSKIPGKMGFKIGEAAQYLGVKQHILRYWEMEFKELRPAKAKNGQRIYTKKEIQVALMIKKLLHEDRFSIEGAQGALKKLKERMKKKKLQEDNQRLNQKEMAYQILESIQKARTHLGLE